MDIKVVAFMKPFLQLFEDLCAEQVPTLQLVGIYYKYMVEKLCKIKNTGRNKDKDKKKIKSHLYLKENFLYLLIYLQIYLLH